MKRSSYKNEAEISTRAFPLESPSKKAEVLVSPTDLSGSQNVS